MNKKQGIPSLDDTQLVGFSQVARVAPENADTQLSSMGRLLSKKGGMEAITSNDNKVTTEGSEK